MTKFINDTVEFLKNVAEDERIPERDKKVILILIGLIFSPIDFIPDWIPIIGQLDDLLMLALVLDYFFEVLDDDVLLSHYPFDLKSFVRLKKFSQFFTWMCPNKVKEHIWQYKKDIYKN